MRPAPSDFLYAALLTFAHIARCAAAILFALFQADFTSYLRD